MNFFIKLTWKFNLTEVISPPRAAACLNGLNPSSRSQIWKLVWSLVFNLRLPTFARSLSLSLPPSGIDFDLRGLQTTHVWWPPCSLARERVEEVEGVHLKGSTVLSKPSSFLNSNHYSHLIEAHKSLRLKHSTSKTFRVLERMSISESVRVCVVY